MNQNREIKVIKSKDAPRRDRLPKFDPVTLRRQLLSMLALLDRAEKAFCCEKCRKEVVG
jgi:hypothetical protein